MINDWFGGSRPRSKGPRHAHSEIPFDDPWLAELSAVQEKMKGLQAAGTSDPYAINCPPWGTLLSSEPSVHAGQLPTGQGLPLPVSHVSRGTLIDGGTGSGKTTLSILLVTQLVLSGVTVIVADLKTKWRQLADWPIIGPLTIPLRTSDLQLCLLQQPPAAPAGAWLNTLSQLIAQSYARLSAQRLLREVFEEELARRSADEWPAIQDVLGNLERRARRRGSRESDYADSVYWPLRELLTQTGDIFNYSRSDLFPRLFGEPGRLFIIEDQGLALDHWNFLISLMQSWAFTQRRFDLSQRFPIVFVIDDGTPLLDPRRDQDAPGGVSALAHQMNLCREMGIGVMAVAHGLRSISPKIMANIESLFFCRLQGEDLTKAQALIGSNGAQTEALRILPPGIACASLPSVWPQPVTIRYPDAAAIPQLLAQLRR